MSATNYAYDFPTGFKIKKSYQGDNWPEDYQTKLEDDLWNKATEATVSTVVGTFKLPLSGSTISLFADLQHDDGTHTAVQFETARDHREESLIVSVFLKCSSKAAKDEILACLFTRPGNEIGFGVFAPKRSNDDARKGIRTCKIVVTFPGFSKIRPPVVIKNFQMNINRAHLYIADLSRIHFENMFVQCQDSIVSVKSLHVANGFISAENAEIRGNFHATESLELKTSSAQIAVNVELESAEIASRLLATYTRSEPHLILTNSNSEINAKLTLSSSTGDGEKYAVTATTTNAPVSVSFLDAPVQSTLQLEAITTNSRAQVDLHPTYVGRFALATTEHSKACVEDVNHNDPRHEGKKKVTSCMKDKNGHLIAGQTRYMKDQSEEQHNGRVVLQTMNGDVILNY